MHISYKPDGNGVSVYNGDLEADLLRLGIPKNHIDQMKLEKPKKIPIYECGNMIVKEKRLVPLSKVVGFSRGDSKNSIFENVNRMADGERIPKRFIDCFSYIEKMGGLSGLYESYERLCYPVRMLHENLDDEYYVSGDGNHRSLTAKLLGAPYIWADVTEAYKDRKATERYIESARIFEAYGIEYVFYYPENDRRGYGVAFKWHGKSFFVYGYDAELSCTDIDRRIVSFEKALRYDTDQMQKIMRKPKVLQWLLLKFQNDRVRKMVNYQRTEEKAMFPNSKCRFPLYCE